MLIIHSVLSLLVLTAPEKATGKLSTYESKYYILETNLPADRAKFIGQVMDGAGKEYDRRFQGFSGTIKSKQRLKVWGTQEQYVEALKKTVGGDRLEHTGGVFAVADGIVYSFESEDLESTLKHECFHQFAHSVVGGHLPVWTNEGLAEYFGDGVFDSKSGQMQLGVVLSYRAEELREAREKKSLMTIDQILDIGGLDWHENMGTQKGSLQYTQSWALCHFLVHADGGKYQPMFDTYLHHIDKGLDGGTAFKRAFGNDRKALQTRYSAYLNELIAKAPPQEKKQKSGE